MKGVAQWILVIGSIIVALIIFAIAYNQILQVNQGIIEQRSIDQYNEIVSNLNNLCWSYIGTRKPLTINLGQTIEGIYAANSSYVDYEKEQLINSITSNKYSSGNYFCLKISNKRLICKNFECNVNFPFIGYIPEQFSLTALYYSLMGKGKIYTYQITLRRDADAINVFISGQEPTTTIPRTSTTSNGTTTTANQTSTTITTTTIVTECKSEELVKSVDSNIMIETLKYLIQNPRNYGSDWNKKTADYISEKLKSYGLDNVHFEDFDSGSGRNVVGEIGTGNNIIVVTGGHRDTPKGTCYSWPCPGAVDNGGGAVNVMEVARVLASCKNYIKNNKLRFVLFDGEELGMVGSGAYATQHMDNNGENINRMVNFDCIGDKDATGLTVYRTADDFSKSADKGCQLLDINCQKVNSAGSSSDQTPFASRGAKILWIKINNGCGSCYHQSCDDINRIGSSQMEWSAKLGTYVLADLYLN